jgi:hypothetical protein
MGATTAGTQTVSRIKGYLDAVYVSVSDGASTGTVSLAIIPLDTGVDAITVVSGSVTNNAPFRPRVDGTDTAGIALTGDPPWRYPIPAGDSLRFIVSNSPTGVTWRATIITER